MVSNVYLSQVFIFILYLMDLSTKSLTPIITLIDCYVILIHMTVVLGGRLNGILIVFYLLVPIVMIRYMRHQITHIMEMILIKVFTLKWCILSNKSDFRNNLTYYLHFYGRCRCCSCTVEIRGVLNLCFICFVHLCIIC